MNTSKPCSICKKPRAPEFTPFCSQRCKDRDLAQWFGDGYLFPGEHVDLEQIARSEWENQE